MTKESRGATLVREDPMTNTKHTEPKTPTRRPPTSAKLGSYVIKRGRLAEFAKVLEDPALRGDVQVLVKPTTPRGRQQLAGAGVRELVIHPGAGEIVKRGAEKRVFYGGGRTEIAEKAYEPGPKARALLRGLEIAEADLKAAGGAFELADVERLLGISRQAIAKRVDEGSLLAVPGPGGRRRYPAVQFTHGGTLPGFREALNMLPSRNPWVRLNWLVNRDPRMGERTPAQLLEAGEVAAVLAAARSQGEQGG